MPCLEQSVGIFHVSLHLFFGQPLLLLPETSSLSDFAQMWLCSRLKQWPNHFSLLLSRKVSTGFTCASFLMSSFLMWSNLVFPLAHLNILISAELSLFSSFFFTAQHSEPYSIAGLMIVLKTLSFNSTGIVLSRITPDTSFHFIHPILILLGGIRIFSVKIESKLTNCLHWYCIHGWICSVPQNIISVTMTLCYEWV